MAKPLLSIGMIIKDEIHCIERCLKSLDALRQEIPCELVIADTGSSDGSREIAEKYADILIDFEWINDFSAARNAVLKRCSGEWYLTIDADEWLDQDISELISFLRSKQGKVSEGAFVVQRNYMTTRNEGDYGDCLIPRMGRMKGQRLRYYGAIHETLWYNINGQKVALKNAERLSHVILHHDGYAGDDEEKKREKGERNLKLLREELKKDPNNLRCLMECAQAAYDKEEKVAFAARLIETAEVLPLPQNWIMLPAVYQTAILCAYIGERYDLVYEWQKIALTHLPNALYLCLDGNGYVALAAYREQNYKDVLYYGKEWENAIVRYDKGEGRNELWRIYSQFYLVNAVWRFKMYCFLFEAACEEKEWDYANKVLKKIQVLPLVPGMMQTMLDVILTHAGHLSNCSEVLKSFWEQCVEKEKENAIGSASLCTQMLEVLILFFQSAKKATPVAQRAIAGMDACDPGSAARILNTISEREIEWEWDHVQNFAWTFPSAFLHTMECRVPLPDRFYQRTTEEQATLASVLASLPGFSRTVVDWIIHGVQPETLQELNWQLDLVTAALRIADWREEVPLGEQLCALYAGLSATYLDNVYNPALLNKDDLSILPGMHRFAWHYRRALACLEDGDELGYVRALHAGLDTAPAMKDMVDFLVDHAPKPQPAPSPELLALAEKVKAALAQYAPDDPAVLQLKATPAYQSVASLLENDTHRPGKEPPDPVLEDTIRSLEKECTFSSPTQAAIALQASYQGVHQAGQKSLADYWAKYPLWGETPDQVFAAAGKAFAEHHDDLFWLFGRLADNQSRRVLLAVLSNWRFYDFWKLNAVKETKYDDYFDLDLIHCDDNEVVADLGAYIGDTFLSYVKNYGSLAYKRYYCYEITSDSFAKLAQATKPYPRVILRRKGAGDGPGTMTLSTGSDASANTLTADTASQTDTTEQETAGETVDIVALDDDITEPLTLIKMDIEGAEQSALRGCARHIREDHPKLALSVYHNFEDIWKLPRMIEELVPGYRFYLRYHGGNLWATEISLLALPPL